MLEKKDFLKAEIVALNRNRTSRIFIRTLLSEYHKITGREVPRPNIRGGFNEDDIVSVIELLHEHYQVDASKEDDHGKEEDSSSKDVKVLITDKERANNIKEEMANEARAYKEAQRKKNAKARTRDSGQEDDTA